MKKKNAFTLIEMVVVILILGILAAVAAPRMFNTSKVAAENATRSSLNVVRNALELYASQNEGVYPDAASITTDLEPFLNGSFPTAQVGDVKGLSAVLASTAADMTTEITDENHGWLYKAATGEFIVNSTDTDTEGAAYSSW